MKKLLLFLVLIAFSATNLYAGWHAGIRSKCRWWSAKYHCGGHLGYSWTMYSYGHDKGCTWALVDFWRSRSGCGGSSHVHSEASGWSAWGYTALTCGMYGGTVSPLFDAVTDGDPTEGSTENNFNEGKFDTDFGPEEAPVTNITLSGIQVNLESSPTSAMRNTYTLTIWTPRSDSTDGGTGDDTTITPDKTLYEGTVILQRGVLSVEGGVFTASDFNVLTEGDKTKVSYVGGDKTFPIPASASEGELMVTGTGDVKPDEAGVFGRAIGTNNGIIKGNNELSVYPNPASSDLSVNINAEKDNTTSIQVYDMQGKLIIEQADVAVKAGKNNSIKINISSLAPGQYFIMATGDDMKILKKFIKE